jgi:hypothetical protein
MKKVLIASLLSQFFLLANSYSQKIKSKDLIGTWATILSGDSTEFAFTDTIVKIKKITYIHRPDQITRNEISYKIQFHIIEFNNETLLIFNENIRGNLFNTYLLRRSAREGFEIQAIQNSDLSDYRVKWNEKPDSKSSVLSRIM